MAHVNRRQYVVIFFALLGLTLLEVGVVYVPGIAKGPLVSALILLALRGAPGQAYNIASGTSHSVTELATMLLEILGLEGRTRITYTGRSWTGDAQRWEVDTTRVQRMGYQPRIDLKQGLRLVVDWFSSSEP